MKLNRSLVLIAFSIFLFWSCKSHKKIEDKISYSDNNGIFKIIDSNHFKVTLNIQHGLIGFAKIEYNNKNDSSTLNILHKCLLKVSKNLSDEISISFIKENGTIYEYEIDSLLTYFPKVFMLKLFGKNIQMDENKIIKNTVLSLTCNFNTFPNTALTFIRNGFPKLNSLSIMANPFQFSKADSVMDSITYITLIYRSDSLKKSSAFKENVIESLAFLFPNIQYLNIFADTVQLTNLNAELKHLEHLSIQSMS